jgi:hypothetical protein
MSHDIMLDLETLATTSDAVILSIGAVRFDLDAGRVFDEPESVFYQSIAIDSQPDRKISGSTLAWWMTQSNEARAVFCEPNGTLYDALDGLGAWIAPQLDTKTHVWSNGADFDLPMLVHAYDQLELSLPWPVYAGRCYRTYKNLPGARGVKVERTGLHHNALDDAIFQAKHLCAIHHALFQATAAEVTA